MKRCLECGLRFARPQAVCPGCGHGPAVVDGYPAFAAELASGGQGFREEFLVELARAEREHFWFRARAALIVWALRKYQPGLASFFDVGCGTGYVLSRVAEAFPGAALSGSELVAAGLRAASKTNPACELVQMDARRIPFADEFDAIGAFDVLEHIAEDGLVLSQMHAALRPGGLLLLTVPQHGWLWSPVDSHSGHVRRYGSAELQAKVRAAGFTVLRSGSFVSLLLPVLLASRLLMRRQPSATAELAVPAVLNRPLGGIMALERLLIRAGIDFPAGGSRFVVARRTGP